MTHSEALTFYHGTSSCFLSEIENHGLVSCRKSSGVYLTPSKERAEAYARTWAVGLGFSGPLKDMEGVVIGCELGDEEKIYEVQRLEIFVKRSIPPKEFTVKHMIPCQNLSELETIGYLLLFTGVVGWIGDAYDIDTTKLNAAKDSAKAFLKSVSQEKLQRAFASVPCL